jgi:hypothetical protein
MKQPAARERRQIRTEVENLMELNHPHIIKVLGCYQELRGSFSFAICALLHPSGDEDLGVFPHESGANVSLASVFHEWIREWFCCLASALRYMHSKAFTTRTSSHPTSSTGMGRSISPISVPHAAWKSETIHQQPVLLWLADCSLHLKLSVTTPETYNAMDPRPTSFRSASYFSSCTQSCVAVVLKYYSASYSVILQGPNSTIVSSTSFGIAIRNHINTPVSTPHVSDVCFSLNVELD